MSSKPVIAHWRSPGSAIGEVVINEPLSIRRKVAGLPWSNLLPKSEGA
jgi:hypothetical protein